MTPTPSVEQIIDRLADLPTDNLQPADYATLDELVAWARAERARREKVAEREAAFAADRAARFKRARFGWFTEAQGYKAVDRRSNGVCECPEGCGQRATVHHHIAGRKIDDPHHPDNLLHLAAVCHDRIHANPEQSYRDGSMRKRLGVGS